MQAQLCPFSDTSLEKCTPQCDKCHYWENYYCIQSPHIQCYCSVHLQGSVVVSHMCMSFSRKTCLVRTENQRIY